MILLSTYNHVLNNPKVICPTFMFFNTWYVLRWNKLNAWSKDLPSKYLKISALYERIDRC